MATISDLIRVCERLIEYVPTGEATCQDCYNAAYYGKDDPPHDCPTDAVNEAREILTKIKEQGVSTWPSD